MPSRLRIDDTQRPRRPTGTDRVPVLSPGAPFLMQALSDDSLSFIEVARAIERVPSVAVRLLALANSAWSAPASPVTSIEVACGRLGLRVVRTVSIALAVSQPFNPARCPPFSGTQFWSSALLNAEAAGWIAQRVCRNDVATARTAGLLSNLGLMWLAEALPTQTGAALMVARDAPMGELNRQLSVQCGMGYDEAGALLAEAWELPSPLRDAIAQQFRNDTESVPLSRVLHGATRMVGHLRRGAAWTEPDPGLTHLGLDMTMQQQGMTYMNSIRVETIELAETLFAVS